MKALHKTAAGVEFDCSGEIGRLYPAEGEPAWPMYSFDRPAHILWNAIGQGLAERGWTEEEIKTWLQSKATRHHLDGTLGDALRALGAEYATRVDREDKGR